MMIRSIELLLIRRYPSSINSICRKVSNIRYEGIREEINENEARDYFDQWLKSLWFAPGGWTQSTKDNAITVTRRYLPFWNFSITGSVNSSVTLTQMTSNRSRNNVLPLSQKYSVVIPLNNLTLNNLNIYASQTLDRHHLNQLNISLDNQRIVQLNNEDKDIEQWTVDKDTAFHIGWDLTIVPQIKYLSSQQAQQSYPHYSNYQTNSFHFDIYSKKERLLYYPIYVINYKYGSEYDFTCLVDGITGEVTGDRQYSFTKVTLTTLIAFYPAALAGIVTLGSMIDPSIGIALASLLSFKLSIPLALIVSPLVGLFAKNYPKIYRDRINQQQWNNYRSNSQQFTYDFTSSYQQQYQSYKQQSYKQETRRESTKEKIMDLYELLSVNRTATDKEIKRAYLLKAKELHPDRNPGDKKSEELFKKVNEAYSILSDKYKRQQYDNYGYDSVKYN